MSRLIIAGGGLAGCLAALAIVSRRPEADIVLVEQGEAFGGNHTWSFFDSDVPQEQRWLLEGLITQHWDDHQIRFPRRSRTVGLGYNSIRSEGLNRLVRSKLRPDQYRLGQSIAHVAEDCVTLESGERIDGTAVVDARGAGQMAGLDLGWQKFVGRFYRYASGHNCRRPMIMDATVDQRDGFRFIYLLPFNDNELLVEDTYYSLSPSLDQRAIEGEVDIYAARLSGQTPELIEQESGVLPVLLGGSTGALWPKDGPSIARLGVRGGFFHPTTGYSLPDAVANAILLAGQPEMTSPSLHALFRKRAEELWDERHFFQLLNRMLFHGAKSGERYRILEHFYRLPEKTIARFYAARLTAFDKLRILSGRPPVPIGRALSSLRKSALRTTAA